MNSSLVQHIIDSLPVLIAYIGADKKYKYVNSAYSNWLELDKADIIENNIANILGPERYAAVKSHVDMALLGQDVSYELTMPSKTENKIFFARYIPFINMHGNVEGFSVLVEDITEQKILEADKNNLVLELQEALNSIKTLEGIIPICSYCHNIRNDEGAWDKVDAYVAKHSHASFSHGVCPNCLQKARADAGLDVD